MTTSIRTRMGAYTCPFKHAEPSDALITYVQPYFKNRSVYVEPMVGAGSVFLNILKTSMIDETWAFKEYRLYDLNHLIISTWKAIKNNPEPLISKVRELMDEIMTLHAKSGDLLRLFLMNLHVKVQESEDDIEKAAFFLVMNKVTGSSYLCAINTLGNTTRKRMNIIPHNCSFDVVTKSIIGTHEVLSMAKGDIIFEKMDILDVEPPASSSIFVDMPRHPTFTRYFNEFIGRYSTKVMSWAIPGNEVVVAGRQFTIDFNDKFQMVPIELFKTRIVIYSYT